MLRGADGGVVCTMPVETLTMLLLVAVTLMVQGPSVPEACVRTGLQAVSKDSMEMEKEGDVGLHERDLFLLREGVEGARLDRLRRCRWARTP
jgi:hypothetical protein